MIMKKIIFGLSILLIIFAISCEKEITIQQKPYTSKLSIQCLITPGAIPRLYLNRTLPYLSPALPNRKMFVADAKVTLKSASESDIMEPDSIFEKFYGSYLYFFKGTKKIKPNTNYTVEIQHSGVNYSASTKTDQPVVKLDSVSYVQNFKDVYGEHEGVVFHLKDDPATANYYRYEMHRSADTATYWGENKFKSPILKGNETTRVSEIGRTIFSDASFSGGNFSFAIEPVFKHKKGDITYVFLQVCDKNMFDFYDQLDKQMLAQKNPFVEPVFFVPQQFPNAFGVFGSYALSDSMLFVYPE